MYEELQEMFVPVAMKDATLPDPRELLYWQMRKQRIFSVDWEIEEDYNCIELAKTIIQMNAEEANIPEEDLKPIYLYVYSFGGDLDQAQALCDVIEASRIPVVTICLGVAMSAGFLIFLAGKRRYAFRQSQFLAHSGSASFTGTAEQISSAQENYKTQLKQMKDYILSHTDIDEKLFNKNKSKDWYITFEDVEKFGIAKVVSSLSEIV